MANEFRFEGGADERETDSWDAVSALSLSDSCESSNARVGGGDGGGSRADAMVARCKVTFTVNLLCKLMSAEAPKLTTFHLYNHTTSKRL